MLTSPFGFGIQKLNNGHDKQGIWVQISTEYRTSQKNAQRLKGYFSLSIYAMIFSNIRLNSNLVHGLVSLCQSPLSLSLSFIKNSKTDLQAIFTFIIKKKMLHVTMSLLYFCFFFSFSKPRVSLRLAVLNFNCSVSFTTAAT